MELKEGKYKEAGMTILRSQAITIHHKAMEQYRKRISKLNGIDKANKATKINDDQIEHCEDEIDLFEDESSGDDEEATTWCRKGEGFEQMFQPSFFRL